MSFIIIGFGKQTRRDLGKTGIEQKCVRCSSTMFYHLILLRMWFTYFFIPVFPYRKEFRIECPVCATGIQLQGEEIKAAKKGQLRITLTTETPKDEKVMSTTKLSGKDQR